MDLTNYESIDDLDYNQLIGIVKETNRPPGGKNTVFEVINRLHISENAEILEVGTSTGFTAIEISRLVKSKITAIDINEISLKEAKSRASKEGYTNIKFLKADVTDLPFPDGSFNVVIVGNVLSLLSNKDKALRECVRVCKRDGLIVAVPMYYLKSPTEKLIKDVSNAIKVKIIPLYKSYWIDFFTKYGLEIYWSKSFKFDYVKDSTVDTFVKEIINRPHLRSIDKVILAQLNSKYKKYMFLFRDNLSVMGYTIFILSKSRIWEDSELYTSEEIRQI